MQALHFALKSCLRFSAQRVDNMPFATSSSIDCHDAGPLLTACCLSMTLRGASGHNVHAPEKNPVLGWHILLQWSDRGGRSGGCLIPFLPAVPLSLCNGRARMREHNKRRHHSTNLRLQTHSLIWLSSETDSEVMQFFSSPGFPLVM